jgi:Flp pilus assembly protein TadG
MRATSRAPTADRDHGGVTVEAAVALGALAVVFGLVLAGVTVVIEQLRCADAAREAARLVARGEEDKAGDAVRRIGPTDAQLSVATAGDEITVRVTASPLAGLLPGVRLDARAFAVREPTDRGSVDPDTDSGR